MSRAWAMAVLLAVGALGAYVHHRDDVLQAQLELLAQRGPGPAPTVTRIFGGSLTAPAPGLDDAAVDAIAARVAARLQEPKGPAATTANAAAAAPTGPSPEAEAALANVHASAEAAIARGHLGRADVLAMREQLAQVAPADAQELRRQLAVQINLGKLVPEDPAFVLP